MSVTSPDFIDRIRSFYEYYYGQPGTIPRSDPGVARRSGADLSSHTSPSASINLATALAIADTEPERNPRLANTETIAWLYREVARLNGRVNYLEQNY